MPSSNANHWTTDPEYIDFLNYIIAQTRNVESPMSVRRMAREFKKKSGVAQAGNVLKDRVNRFRTKIHSSEHIDTKTKVKMMFALSAPVNADFLKKLKADALVEVDDKQRITHYKSNDGSFELSGDHSSSAKSRTVQLESKQSIRSWIIDYFENKNDSNAVPQNEGEKEMWSFIEFITEKCENVNTPLNITRMATDFNNHFGISKHKRSIEKRVEEYRREIQTLEFLDTPSKVKQLFCLSETLSSEFLKELRKEALVNVDEKNRIVHYKANDGSLELRGDHSLSAKMKTAKLESKRNFRNVIIGYFENKKNAEAVPNNNEKKEMWNFIGFINEKCENVNTPLNISQLTVDFNNHFGTTRSLSFFHNRAKGYCREIQDIEFMDTPSKVKQLFGLSAALNWNFLKELREDAMVEVDNLNRITKYTANNGSLTLNGDHSHSAKQKLNWIEWNKKQNAPMNYCNSVSDYEDESEKEIDHPGDYSDEYSREEFGNGFDSDNDNSHLDYTEDPVEKLNKEISIGFNLDFDLSTERLHRSEEIEMIDAVEETTNPEITENAVIKTRSGRLSKKRHLDSNFSYDLANSSNSGALMGSSSSYSKPAKHFDPPTERSHVSKVIEMREDDGRKRKKRNNYTPETSSSNWTGESSNNSMRPNELDDDDDTNSSINDFQVKLEPFRGSLRKNLNEFEEDEDIQLILKPQQAHDEHNEFSEVPIKVEPEELKIVENPTEDVKPEIAQGHDEHKELIEFPIKVEHEEPVEVKPETSHNSKIKFFEAMHSLILCLDNPSLSWIQSKINQKIQELEKSDEVILNNKIVLIIQLLVSRMTNDSVVNLSETAETVNLSNFLCYLKAAILNSKLIGVEGLTKNISRLIEESQNKRIPMENVANTLRATLDIDGS
ncbi:unnamed protein product [Caenorhabditis brenneri]